MDINLKVQNLLVSKKYFVKINKRNYKKKYWSKTKDPDGKIRDRLTNHEIELKKFVLNNKSLIKRINLLKFRSLCDVGCGSGYLLSQFNNKQIDLLGIDNDSEAIKIASKYATILKRNLNSTNLNINKKFDLVVCYHVIEHLKNPKKLIKNLYRLLKKNGILIIGTPDFDSGMARLYKNKYRMLHDKTHISLFSKESLIRFLTDNDFKPIIIDYPYFDTSYFNKKNLLKIFNLKGYSPPFYGNMITIISKKMI